MYTFPELYLSPGLRLNTSEQNCSSCKKRIDPFQTRGKEVSTHQFPDPSTATLMVVNPFTNTEEAIIAAVHVYILYGT